MSDPSSDVDENLPEEDDTSLEEEIPVERSDLSEDAAKQLARDRTRQDKMQGMQQILPNAIFGAEQRKQAQPLDIGHLLLMADTILVSYGLLDEGELSPAPYKDKMKALYEEISPLYEDARDAVEITQKFEQWKISMMSPEDAEYLDRLCRKYGVQEGNWSILKRVLFRRLNRLKPRAYAILSYLMMDLMTNPMMRYRMQKLGMVGEVEAAQVTG